MFDFSLTAWPSVNVSTRTIRGSVAWPATTRTRVRRGSRQAMTPNAWPAINCPQDGRQQSGRRAGPRPQCRGQPGRGRQCWGKTLRPRASRPNKWLRWRARSPSVPALPATCPNTPCRALISTSLTTGFGWCIPRSPIRASSGHSNNAGAARAQVSCAIIQPPGGGVSDVSLGVLIPLAAGPVNGSFAAPTKYTTRWKWEHIWAVWAVVALFISPWLLAFLRIPVLVGFYGNTSAGFILLLAAFGFGVGLAQVFFGLALAAVGLSIGFAVTIGLSTALGSL